ncbi:twin-arginine translocation signal domain-containing protein [Chitinophaga defluvii]|uniref:Twin-arginine translocation signal domain-containing protein n=1 Tax=Chitinophaga defluvii TaxID=3163343 RepID=A0ABV2TB95_9BACT
MRSKNWSRRSFIQQSAILGAGLGMLPLVSWKTPESSDFVQFISPIDGDMLHAGDGVVVNVKVAPVAAEKVNLSINNIPAKEENGVYSADITLKDFENKIRVKDTLTGRKSTITVFYLRKLNHQYRLSIDDAIWFLKDIHLNAAVYSSIFENSFMGLLRSLHETYGTKVHINLFYETDNFNLSQMTDKFKKEWKDNSDWIRLSVHAKAEFPDDPYMHADYGEMYRDCHAIRTQIARFAGKEVMDNTTTLHWGQVPVEVCRALRDEGYKIQVCDFNVDNNLPPCSYYLDVPHRRHINKRFIWRDNREKIIFVKSSIIIDTVKLPLIKEFLDSYGENNITPPYVDLLVHEQYFYPFYKNYQIDYREKLTAAIEWAQQHNYTPCFISECII